VCYDVNVHTHLAGFPAVVSACGVGLHPIVTFQYSSTTAFQFSYHIQ
jgi:hypothetical protein